MLIRSTMEKFSFHRGETFVPSWGSFCSTMVERINIGNVSSY
ncbi:hypothetical protein HMPREF9445_00881 [Bacteroides clarus YIT 12056]|uniref:Uncharacterized protein n=1 Tax=Bacteroides clarus YIT 12056 TaxID=762984 RepID=A0ABP2KUG2_9BACE|nr:hypothetical protein HMPREF9445_00881 [Bacteroides clarus YIT 12056]